MTSWSLVATVKAPEEKVLAFVAHHLSLGASRIWLYFDDPEDPAHAILSRHPRVTSTLCDTGYWLGRKRHDRHQNRQSRNARDAYERADTDWMGHIDVDEFIQSDRPLSELLGEVAPGDNLLKLEPFEAMHDPALPDDIYTARTFRGPLRQDFWRLRWRALGKYRFLIPDGMFSHSVGKVFFRTGIPDLSPRLHSVMLHGKRLHQPGWHSEARLLHFHAQDQKEWLTALPFRLTRGAYQYRPEMQDYLEDATPAEVEKFYKKTQTLNPKHAEALLTSGRMIKADLGLRQKIAALLAGDFD
ncbi:Glycosyl transferase family 2 [Paracoccaceae bacterium]|jgi:hypothetical protein